MEERPISAVMKEILNSLSSLLRSELRLAKVELVHTGKDIGKHAAKSAVWAGVIFFGALALLTFAIIGLGILLGDRYWLSSLLIGAAMVIPGALLLMRNIKQISQEAKLPAVKEHLEEDKELVERKVHDITQHTRYRTMQ